MPHKILKNKVLQTFREKAEIDEKINFGHKF
jgi:hypothetical protein